MRETTRGSMEMTIAMTLMGTIGWFVVMSGETALDVVFWRCLFGALALGLICAAMGLFKGRITKRQIGLAALGGVTIVLNWILLFSAFPRASISISTAFYNTQPFILIVLGATFFGEKLTLRTIALLAIAFTGIVVITQARPEAGYVGADYFTGILMAFGAAFLWAIAAISTKALKGVRPHLIAFIQVSVGILVLMPFANFSDLPTGPQSWIMLIPVLCLSGRCDCSGCAGFWGFTGASPDIRNCSRSWRGNGHDAGLGRTKIEACRGIAEARRQYPEQKL